MRDPGTPLVAVEKLSKKFTTRGRGAALAHDDRPVIDDVSFTVSAGEIVGLVGESGSGKSTIAKCLAGLVSPSSGTIRLGGVDLASVSPAHLREMRRDFQLVFQDATAALPARMTVRQIVEEPLRIHRLGTREEQRAKARESLDLVGISSAYHDRRPFALSGGQRQRIGLARALVLDPKFVVLDEPISGLDVSLQAQILNLILDLNSKLDVSFLFIVHDLTIAEQVCDRVMVLYAGQMVELADAGELFADPRHPYTVSLLSATPLPDPRHERERGHILLSEDETPGPHHGCIFHGRCPVGSDREVCRSERPPMSERTGGHWTACHFPGELRLSQRGDRSSSPPLSIEGEGNR